MTSVFHRRTASPPPRAVRAEGLSIFDAQGREYLDASGGAAVSCLGHGHPAVVAAIKTQVETLDYAHTGFFTSGPAEDLAANLAAASGGKLPYAYFVSGGSEAMEAALKIARQYHLERGAPSRTRIVARLQSYHGNTLGALSTGGNLARREPFAPLLFPVEHVEPCFAYRFRRDGESEADYGRRAADALEAAIQRLGPENVAAFVAETVVGATAGCVTASDGYFRRIREICDRHGVLLILDEVMCGMGRTGTMFAFEQEGISPDICIVAKGLGGGFQPIGAALVSQKIYDAFARGSGGLVHGHTYVGHPVACAAALAVQETIAKDRLLDNVVAMGAYLNAKLTERFGNSAHVGDIRGRGLFQALEFVADRTTKAPFPPARGIAAKLKAEAMARGLLVYPMAGTVDGTNGDHVVLAPPYTVTAAQIDEIVRRLGDAVDATLSG